MATGLLPVVAMTSAMSRSMTMPSLSVVQARPSLRRKEAPALSSPPKPIDRLSSPSTKCLKPTGVSTTSRPWSFATRSSMPLVTTVLPTALPGQSRLRSRWSTATERTSLGAIRPPSATMPCRS